MGLLDDKVALITGAASGIGRATAVEFAAEGATVVAADFNADGMQETVEKLRADGHTATGVTVDVADSASAQAAVDSAIAEHGRVDVLCNIAGILHFENSHQVTDDEWQRILDVNVNGTFFMTRAVIPPMLERGSGVILNTASSAGHVGHPWAAAYSASKGAILALTRTLAVEYGRQGLRVCSVSPAGIQTPIQGAFKFPDGADHSLITRIMSYDGDFGPEYVAATFAFLASDRADRINGADVKVDDAMMA